MESAKICNVGSKLAALKNKAIEVLQLLGLLRDIPTCKRIIEIESCYNTYKYMRNNTTAAERGTQQWLIDADVLAYSSSDRAYNWALNASPYENAKAKLSKDKTYINNLRQLYSEDKVMSRCTKEIAEKRGITKNGNK